MVAWCDLLLACTVTSRLGEGAGHARKKGRVAQARQQLGVPGLATAGWLLVSLGLHDWALILGLYWAMKWAKT